MGFSENMIKRIHISFFLFVLLVVQVESTYAEESYRFERMWPTLQQPWYFGFVLNISISKSGNVFVADKWNNQIIKMNLFGKVITSVNRTGGTIEKLNEPVAITLDDEGFVYVASNISGQGRDAFSIHKYDSNLNYIEELIYYEVSPYHRVRIYGMHIHGDELIITLQNDIDSNSLWTDEVWIYSLSQKKIVNKWDPSIYQFDFRNGGAPVGAVITDSIGNIYISTKREIRKYDSEGSLILSWGTQGTGEGEFEFGAVGFDFDSEDNLYVCSSGSAPKILKFTSSGEFISAIDLSHNCSDLEVFENNGGKTFFTTSSGIDEFDESGNLINSWNARTASKNTFSQPTELSVDSDDNIYIFDPPSVIKLDNRGIFVDKFIPVPYYQWRDIYVLGHELYAVGKISVDGILQPVMSIFDLEGNFKSTTTLEATTEDPNIWDFLVDDQGFIYAVFDQYGSENRLVKYSADGKVVAQYTDRTYQALAFDQDGFLLASFRLVSPNVGIVSSGWAKFDLDFNLVEIIDISNLFSRVGNQDLRSLAVEQGGYILILQEQILNNGPRMYEFSPEGELIKTAIAKGAGAGQASSAGDLVLDSKGNLYVTDWGSVRLQKFKKVDLADQSKAIVVAAGGPFAGNNLWDTTQLSANFAYRTLTYQGFTKDSIYYLSSDTDLDLDQNGVADDVDADATNANLEYAITEWAADADNLLI